MELKPSKSDAIEAARQAHLTYWSDQAPAIRRVRRGGGFIYLLPRGQPLRQRLQLERIRRLAIPPAWTNVRICPDPSGHLQATGYDARKRKQYRYHERWRMVRDDTKFDRLLDFARVLPKIRRRVATDLRRPGLPREKVLATVVRLLETTLIRVGNEEYAATNHSYGLTTLRNRHVEVRRGEIRFEFRGKSGVHHCITVDDRRLARIIKRCQEIPGQELFQYLDEAGNRHAIGSADVNEYLRAAAGGEYTAKDFRTWGATVLAARAFHELPVGESEARAKRHLVRAVADIAQQLGNTPAVCRKCYIHSGIIDCYLTGTLARTLHLPGAARTRTGTVKLTQEEAAVMRWLQQCG